MKYIEIENEAALIRSEILNKVQLLQEPVNCTNTQYLICKPSGLCAFGCILNAILQCLSHAHITNKTMVVNIYRPMIKDMLKYLLPISKCENYYNENNEIISNSISTIHLTTGWDTDNEEWFPNYAKAFFNRSNMQYPKAWFLGILNKYLFRGFPVFVLEFMNNKSIEMFGKNINEIHFNASCHIRRTDKVGIHEMVEHSVREYVNELDHFFVINNKRNYHMSYDKKYAISVYLATDEPKVIKEINETFQQYEWYYNTFGAESANKLSGVNRLHEDNVMLNAIFDLIMLTKGKYFVGTYSSNWARIVLQLKANQYVNPAQYMYSLDDKWYGAV